MSCPGFADCEMVVRVIMTEAPAFRKLGRARVFAFFLFAEKGAGGGFKV